MDESDGAHEYLQQQPEDHYEVLQTRKLTIAETLAHARAYQQEKEADIKATIEAMEQEVRETPHSAYREELGKEIAEYRRELDKLITMNAMGDVTFDGAQLRYRYWQTELDNMIARFEEMPPEDEAGKAEDARIREAMEHNVRLLHVAAYQHLPTNEVRKRIEQGIIPMEDADIAVEAYLRNQLAYLEDYFQRQLGKPMSQIVPGDISAGESLLRSPYAQAKELQHTLNEGFPGLLQYVTNWKNTFKPDTNESANLDTIEDKIRSEIVT